MRIKDLATRATKLLTGNAYMVFDNGTKVEKVNYAELAKQIITEYNTQTLAGSAQSVKSALDALNSNCTAQQLSNVDLNTLTAPNKVYYAAGGNNCTNVPTGVVTFGLKNVRTSAGYIQQVLTSTGREVFERQYDGTTWAPWRKNPTRLEIEDINGKLPYKGALPTGTDLLTVLDPGIYLLSGNNTYVNSPSTYGMFEVIMHVKNTTNRVRVLRITTVNAIWVRYIINDSDTGEWVKIGSV